MVKLSHENQIRYELFMQKYYHNGVFVFSDIIIDETSKGASELLEIVQQYRLNNMDATNAMMKLIEEIYSFLDGIQAENNLQKRLYSILFSLNEEEMLLAAINARYLGYRDILEYEIEEDEEMKYLWRY